MKRKSADKNFNYSGVTDSWLKGIAKILVGEGKEPQEENGMPADGLGHIKDLWKFTPPTGGKPTSECDGNFTHVGEPDILDEKAPPKFPKKLYNKIKKQYSGQPDKAYATMWKIHNKLKEQSTNVPTSGGTRPLYQIASAIRKDWKNVNYAAKPYLDAMSSLDSIHDDYGADPGTMIVAYFLSNASTWRGPVAKQIKLELGKMLKSRHSSKPSSPSRPSMEEPGLYKPGSIFEKKLDEFGGVGDDKKIADIISKFPKKFGLRAFPNEVFRISTSSSFVNDNGKVLLYTKIYKNGKWQSFAKGTEEELRKEIIELPDGIELSETSTSGAAPGYSTPFAFTGGKEKNEKHRSKTATTGTGYKIVGTK